MANGWSTFETWKIWHEVFIDLEPETFDPEERITPEWCYNYVEVALEIGDVDEDDFIAHYRSLKDTIVLSWLMQVNWSEIADALNDELFGSSITT